MSDMGGWLVPTLLTYLLIGAGSAVAGELRGDFTKEEGLFYLFFWPIQALFWMVVGIHHLLDAALSIFFGEKP